MNENHPQYPVNRDADGKGIYEVPAAGIGSGYAQSDKRSVVEGNTIERDGNAMSPTPEHILQFFTYAHLPPRLREVSRQFYSLAHAVVEMVPRNPERTVALRKLLESKDAAVRAALAKEG